MAPRLVKQVPGQPTPEQLQADRYLSRFVTIFDMPLMHLTNTGRKPFLGPTARWSPAWRELDRQSRVLKGKLTQRQARFAALTLHPQAEPSQIENWERQKTDLRE